MEWQSRNSYEHSELEVLNWGVGNIFISNGLIRRETYQNIRKEVTNDSRTNKLF